MALKIVTKQKRYHKELEAILNLLHTFYSDHKKATHYHATGKYLDVKVLRLKKIFDIR